MFSWFKKRKKAEPPVVPTHRVREFSDTHRRYDENGDFIPLLIAMPSTQTYITPATTPDGTGFSGGESGGGGGGSSWGSCDSGSSGGDCGGGDGGGGGD